MKLVFMGTPDFSVPVLDALIKNHEVVCVYSQAPKKSGRGHKVIKTPIHEFAEKNNIEVRTPKSLRNTEEQEKFAALGADLAIVAAYGLILPTEILQAFPKGCINIHASLLPRWRGAAPIQRVVEAGDLVSGITIMQMDEGLDTGDMLLKGEVAITETTTGGELHDKLSAIGADLIIKTLDDLDNIVPEKQDDSLSTYAPKIDKAECLLDFNNSAEYLERKIRAFNPYPATYFIYNDERFKVLSAEAVKEQHSYTPGQVIIRDSMFIACKTGLLHILKIQRQGKKPMKCSDFLKGFSFGEIVICNDYV